MSTNENIEEIFKFIKSESELKDNIILNKKYNNDVKNLLKIPVYNFIEKDKINISKKINNIIKINEKNIKEMKKKRNKIIDDMYKIIKTFKNNHEIKYILNLKAFYRLFKKDIDEFKKVCNRNWEIIEKIVYHYKKNLSKDFIYLNFNRNKNKNNNLEECKHYYKEYLDSIDINNIINLIIYILDNSDNFFEFVKIENETFVLESEVVEKYFNRKFDGGWFGIPIYFYNRNIWEGEKIVIVNNVEYSLKSPSLKWIRKRFQDEIKKNATFIMKK